MKRLYGGPITSARAWRVWGWITGGLAVAAPLVDFIMDSLNWATLLTFVMFFTASAISYREARRLEALKCRE